MATPKPRSYNDEDSPAPEKTMTRSLRRRAVRLGLLFLLAVPVAAIAQSDSGATEVPRTPWGDPDLQGIWLYHTSTPLQRAEVFADKAVLTPEEAAAYVQERLAAIEQILTRMINADWGARTGLSNGRTSQIIDPPKGRLPALTATGQHAYS